MFIYFFSFFLLFVSIFIKQSQYKEYLACTLCFLCIFLCFGYMTGTDWRNYETIYEKIDLDRLFFDYHHEPGFYVYLLLFKYLDIDFFNVLVFTKVLCFIAVFSTILNYAKEYKYIAMMYFVPWYGFYLFIDNPLRNLIAISIFLCALPHLLNRKFLPYLLLSLLAMSFHITAFIAIPIYFFLTKKINSICWILLFIIFNLVFADRNFIMMLISKLFGSIPYIEGKIENYFELTNEFAKGRVLSLGMIVHTTFFVLLIRYRALFDSDRKMVVVFNSAIVYLLFYRLATTIEVLSRFQLYFAIFFAIAIATLVLAFTERSKTIYISMLLGLCVIAASNKIFADYRYIPYTNYLAYVLKGDFPSFAYRSAYNMNNSPYKGNTDE